MEDSINLKEQLEKGSLAGDFGAQERIRKPQQDKPVQSNWKREYTYILLILIVIGAGYFAYYKYTHISPSENFIEEDSLLKIYRDDYYTYNNYEFRQDKNKIWNTQVYDPINNDLYSIGFHYGPKDILDIPINRKANDLLVYSLNFSPEDQQLGENVGALFLLMDPYIESSKQTLSFFELKNSLETTFKLKIGAVFTNKHLDRPEIPTRKCGETYEPIIYLKWANPAQITMFGDNCIVVQGQGDEMLRSVDRLLYLFYNIMP